MRRLTADHVLGFGGNGLSGTRVIQHTDRMDDCTERISQFMRQYGEEIVLGSVQGKRNVVTDHGGDLQFCFRKGVWLVVVHHELAEQPAGSSQRKEAEGADTFGKN